MGRNTKKWGKEKAKIRRRLEKIYAKQRKSKRE
jgi:hypothetical protein